MPGIMRGYGKRRAGDPTHVQADTPDRPSTMGKQYGEVTAEPTPDFDDLDPNNDVVTSHAGYPGEPESAAPVYLTEAPPTARSFTGWTPGRITASAQPQEIAGRERRRQRLVLHNLSETETVNVLVHKTDSPWTGFPLLPGKDVEFLHNGPISVQADVDALVGWWSEFDTDDVLD